MTIPETYTIDPASFTTGMVKDGWRLERANYDGVSWWRRITTPYEVRCDDGCQVRRVVVEMLFTPKGNA